MKLKCVAIDDEPLALKIIKEFALRLGNLQLISFNDPEEGFRYITESHPHIVFLDIEMCDSNGLTIASKLPKDTNIIFTTAFMQYALEGFNLDAVDYLHKPFSFQRFSEAIEKAIRRIKYTEHQAFLQKKIIVKQSYNNVPVRLVEIAYIEAMENYSKIFLKGGSLVTAHISLKKLLEKLEGENFIRIHKSFVIPRSDIKSYTRQNILLNSGIELPVGRQYFNALIDLTER